jgi:mannosyl-oligosaccharide alpha-1,2-mannosidase
VEGFTSYVFDDTQLHAKTLKFALYKQKFPHVAANEAKHAAVKEAFLYAWRNYDKYCFGHDTYAPLSQQCRDTLHGDLTIMDSLSTLVVINLTSEFAKAREFVLTKFQPGGSWFLFEFMIRYVGGLVSART